MSRSYFPRARRAGRRRYAGRKRSHAWEQEQTDPIRHLQQTVGNRAVGKMLSGSESDRTPSGNAGVAQLAKARPTEDMLHLALKTLVKDKTGSAASLASQVQGKLEPFAESPKDISGFSLAWQQNAEADADAGAACHHAAAAITWREGTYVVDTAIASFGGPPQVAVMPVDEWKNLVMKLTGGVNPVLTAGLKDKQQATMLIPPDLFNMPEEAEDAESEMEAEPAPGSKETPFEETEEREKAAKPKVYAIIRSLRRR